MQKATIKVSFLCGRKVNDEIGDITVQKRENVFYFFITKCSTLATNV